MKCVRRKNKYWPGVFAVLATLGCGEDTNTGDLDAASMDASLESAVQDAEVDAGADTAGPDASRRGPVYYELRYDDVSMTYYYLTHIKHRDADGKLLRLQIAQSVEEAGESVQDFAMRIGTPRVATNASMGRVDLPDDVREPVGIQILDGEILQEEPTATKIFTLGIRDDNELRAYPFGTTAQEILDDGTNNALTAFIPLIENYQPVSDEVQHTVGNLSEPNPRQIIAQFENLDIMFMSVGGRGYGGEGMTVLDMIRILEAYDGPEGEVRFAFNLDGGGSVTTVIDGKRITPQIDGNGTMDRLRPNFLYVE